MLTRLTKGFFDASRTQVQAGAYVIGGYVARESFWTDFETEWSANLDYWQIDNFHLTDCLAGGPGYSRPGFDRHKRQLCALSFGQIINRRKPVAIWAGVLDEEWQEFEASDAFRRRYPTPYQFLFQDIIWRLAKWANYHAPGEMVAPIFDLDADPRSVDPIYAALKTSPAYDNLVPSVTWGSRKKYVPLQAADIIAGEMQLHWFNREYPDDPAPKFPEFRNLLVYATPNGSVGGLWTDSTLKTAAEFFDLHGDPFEWGDIILSSSQERPI